MWRENVTGSFFTHQMRAERPNVSRRPNDPVHARRRGCRPPTAHLRLPLSVSFHLRFRTPPRSVPCVDCSLHFPSAPCRPSESGQLMEGDILDAKFAEVVQRICRSLDRLERISQVRCEKWLARLKEPMRNLAWRRNRNDYAKLLLLQVSGSGHLEAPFDKLPKSEELSNLPSWLKVKISSASSKKTGPQIAPLTARNLSITASATAGGTHQPLSERPRNGGASVSSAGGSRVPGDRRSLGGAPLPAAPAKSPGSATSRSSASSLSLTELMAARHPSVTRTRLAADGRGNGPAATTPAPAASVGQPSNKQSKSGQRAVERLAEVTQELEDLRAAYSREKETNDHLQDRITQLEIQLESSRQECSKLEQLLAKMRDTSDRRSAARSIPAVSGARSGEIEDRPLEDSVRGPSAAFDSMSTSSPFRRPAADAPSTAHSRSFMPPVHGETAEDVSMESESALAQEQSALFQLLREKASSIGLS